MLCFFVYWVKLYSWCAYNGIDSRRIGTLSWVLVDNIYRYVCMFSTHRVADDDTYSLNREEERTHRRSKTNLLFEQERAVATNAVAWQRRRAMSCGGRAAHHPIRRGEGHRGPDTHAHRRDGGNWSSSSGCGGVSLAVAWRVRTYAHTCTHTAVTFASLSLVVVARSLATFF